MTFMTSIYAKLLRSRLLRPKLTGLLVLAFALSLA